MFPKQAKLYVCINIAKHIPSVGEIINSYFDFLVIQQRFFYFTWHPLILCDVGLGPTTTKWMAEDGKAKQLQVLKGGGTSGTGHWQDTSAVALKWGEMRQSMKLGTRVTQWPCSSLEESSAWDMCCAGKVSYCVCSLQALSLYCKCTVFVKIASSIPRSG